MSAVATIDPIVANICRRNLPGDTVIDDAAVRLREARKCGGGSYALAGVRADLAYCVRHFPEPRIFRRHLLMESLIVDAQPTLAERIASLDALSEHLESTRAFGGSK